MAGSRGSDGRETTVSHRPFRGGELAIVACISILVAVAMSWPLVLRLGTVVPHDNGDPLLQAWQVAWIGHALLHQPFHLFQANTFWPLPDSLAFSDAPIGYAPASLVAEESPHAAIVVYDLLYLLAYALASFGAYVLARELGLRPASAAVTGAAFAYAPWRFGEDAHLHVLSSGGVPLALALLLHGYRHGSARAALAGWLVAAWQITLGFTLGLQLAVLLLGLVIVAIVALPGVRRPNRRLLAATLAGVAVFGLVALAQARPYLRVIDEHPEAKRSLIDVFRFSPPVQGFLAAPSGNLVWGAVTSRARAGLPFPSEQTLFPGLAVMVLAAVGAFARAFPRRLRVGLVLGVAACAVLSLGVRHTPLGYVGPYRLLYELVPGWKGIRTPGRLNTLTSLGLALLAGAGAAAVLERVRTRVRSPNHRAVVAVAALLVAAVVVEGRGTLTLAKVPTVPRGLALAAAPVLELPSDYLHDLRYTYWSTAGFRPLANGASGFDPTQLVALREGVRDFPDEKSVRALRAARIRSVVLHPDLAVGTPWDGAERRSIAGLPLTRTRVGETVVYTLKN